MRHVVWDWNGTLLDDLDLVVESVNAALAGHGAPEIDAATYTAHYTRPVRRFYEVLLERPIRDEEWDEIDDVFHHHYDRVVHQRATLAADATDALDAVDDLGLGQSLLSMYRHEPLVALVDRLDLRHRFAHVQGLTGPGGGAKEPHLRRHLGALGATGEDPSRVLVVGDALDDARAAAAVGASCVLVDSGSHPRAELEAAGVPVVESLLDALEAAELS